MLARRRIRFLQLRNPIEEKASLRVLVGKGQCGFIGAARFGLPSEASIHVGARGVGKTVGDKIAAREDCARKREANRRSVAHGDRCGSIELDDRRWLNAQQLVVEADDRGPVCVVVRARLRVQPGNGGPANVGPERPRLQRRL